MHSRVGGLEKVVVETRAAARTGKPSHGRILHAPRVYRTSQESASGAVAVETGALHTDFKLQEDSFSEAFSGINVELIQPMGRGSISPVFLM